MKAPKKKAPRKPPKEYQARILFDGGSTEGILSHEEGMVQMTLNAARMFSSDEPALREAGKQQLAAVAKMATKYEASGFTNKISATEPRPNKGSELKLQIISTMRSPKKEGKTFHEFILSWEQYPVNGLRLTKAGKSKKVKEQLYKIEEEYGEKSNELQYSSLQTKYWATIK